MDLPGELASEGLHVLPCSFATFRKRRIKSQPVCLLSSLDGAFGDLRAGYSLEEHLESSVCSQEARPVALACSSLLLACGVRSLACVLGPLWMLTRQARSLLRKASAKALSWTAAGMSWPKFGTTDPKPGPDSSETAMLQVGKASNFKASPASNIAT